MYKAKKGFKLRALGNEFILVGESIEQINFNKMLTMNETAAFLWHQVNEEHSFPKFDASYLAERLCAEYEVTQEQALKDSEATILSWQNAGIIEQLSADTL